MATDHHLKISANDAGWIQVVDSLGRCVDGLTAKQARGMAMDLFHAADSADAINRAKSSGATDGR